MESVLAILSKHNFIKIQVVDNIKVIISIKGVVSIWGAKLLHSFL